MSSRQTIKRLRFGSRSFFGLLWSVIICVWLGLGVSYFVFKPNYTATAEVLVKKNADTYFDLAQSTSQLTKAAKLIGGVRVTADQLKQQVSVTRNGDSEMINIKATASAKTTAVAMTNAVLAQVGTQVTAKTLQKTKAVGGVPLFRNVLISLIVGLAIGGVYAFKLRDTYVVPQEIDVQDDGMRRQRF